MNRAIVSMISTSSGDAFSIMTTIADARLQKPPDPVAETVRAPEWVRSLIGCAKVPHSAQRLETVEGNGFALTSRTIANATSLSALDLQHAVCSMYLDIAARLKSLAASHPVRWWNFIPRIHARMGSRDEGLLDRYMVFNAGRYAAYVLWHGQEDVGSQAATATGIGHGGSDLVLHCLSAVAPGEPIENPRQVPAYRYSKRRGPMPPCFARATLVRTGGTPLLLVGGTASVRGEDSVHLGDVAAQALETFRNMAALLGAGSSTRSMRGALARYRSLRVYMVHPMDGVRLRTLVTEHFPGVELVEFIRADVCRRTLLIEIEGTADASGVLR